MRLASLHTVMPVFAGMMGVVLTVLLLATPARADTPRGMDLLYSCSDKGLVLKKHTIKTAAQISDTTTKGKDGQTTKPVKKKVKPKGEEIKTSSLINLADPAAPETSLRKDSKILNKTCGELSVTIKAGYHNANPHGTLGGVVFPIISVAHKGKMLVDDLRMGNGSECEQPDIADKAACHKKWAKKASFLINHQKVSVLLARDYVERQDVTVNQ